MKRWSIKRLYKDSVSFRWGARFFILSTLIALFWGMGIILNIIFNINIKNFALSIFQKGGITAGQVHINQPDRELPLEAKEIFKKILPNDKTREIIIKVTHQDAETIRFAHKIKDYLLSLGCINTTVFKGFVLFETSRNWEKDIEVVLDKKDNTIKEIIVTLPKN